MAPVKDAYKFTVSSIYRDISLGREKNPLPCLNAVDNEPYPTDYLYVNHNVETQDLHINAIITSLQVPFFLVLLYNKYKLKKPGNY